MVKPFRRLSKKPSITFSDPQFAISNFEKKTGQDYLPQEWNLMTENDKLNYIVNNRYANILANKIMKDIQHEDVECCFSLSQDGDILSYARGTQKNVLDLYNATIYIAKSISENDNYNFSKAEFLIHNHTSNVKISAFSAQDIYNSILNKLKIFMIDKQGNRYSFTPKTNLHNEEAESIALKYQEFSQLYKESLIEKFNKLNEIFENKEITSKNIISMKFKEYIDLGQKIKTLLQGDDLSYMNEILASKIFQKFGKFEQFIKNE